MVDGIVKAFRAVHLTFESHHNKLKLLAVVAMAHTTLILLISLYLFWNT